MDVCVCFVKASFEFLLGKNGSIWAKKACTLYLHACMDIHGRNVAKQTTRKKWLDSVEKKKIYNIKSCKFQWPKWETKIGSFFKCWVSYVQNVRVNQKSELKMLSWS